ncbi:MAG: peptidoglycan-associated lipoprotein [Elusimicrobia bacterium]|nr:MAG: peptidoglycan-associated lipoprotein [Elusimicrobiota bacterium]
MRLLLALLLLAPLTALAQNMRILAGDDSAEVKEAAQELRELERRIKRKDIPPISFELNKAVLKPEAKAALDFVADVMLKHPDLKLMVFGHTCDLGSDEYNLWLSQKRAEAVKDYLVEIGVMGEFVRAKGFGEAKPLEPNDSEETRSMNRRVEFVIVKRWWDSIY